MLYHKIFVHKFIFSMHSAYFTLPIIMLRVVERVPPPCFEFLSISSIVSCSVPLSSFQLLLLFYFIHFCSIPSLSIPFSSVLFYSIPFRFLRIHSIAFHYILFPFYSSPFCSAPCPFHLIVFLSFPFCSFPFVPIHSLLFCYVPFHSICVLLYWKLV